MQISLDAEIHSIGLADELLKVAKAQAVFYFNADSVTKASAIDGIHLDEPQHELLGEALAEYYLTTLK